jgi:hypothetical protein
VNNETATLTRRAGLPCPAVQGGAPRTEAADNRAGIALALEAIDSHRISARRLPQRACATLGAQGPFDDSIGKALAGELREEVAALGLRENLAVLYVGRCRALRLRWYDAAEALDVPATPDWAQRLRAYLRAYARARR